MFGHTPKDIVEVRKFNNREVQLTQQDLDAEVKFLAIKDKPLNTETAEMQTIKLTCFQVKNGFGSANLTRDDKDVLLRIGDNTSGQDILNLYIPHYIELLDAYDIVPFALDILFVRNCIETLPTILKSLMVKGAISEVPRLDNKKLPANN